MKANMHLHSRYSDGLQWPEEVAARAAHVGLDLAVLTDHDSMEGSSEFTRACTAFDVKSIKGAEIDCVAPEIGFNSEILAYFPGGDCPHTTRLLRELVNEREQKMVSYIEKARDLFKRNDLEFKEVKEMKIGFTPLKKKEYHFSYTKVDLYLYLNRKGLVSGDLSYRKFKSDFRSSLFPEELDTKPDLVQTVKTILSDNGYPVLAHPGILFEFDLEKMRNEIDQFRKILKHCKNAGMWGIEMYFYRENREQFNKLVREEADKLGFRYTYGTDCHGRNSQFDTIELSHGEFDLSSFD
ncbi:MAG: PHP domain-containing protein [Spirochaetales bacterium]|nr:PHP domain-containing protein [Spirochaetales bacterium]